MNNKFKILHLAADEKFIDMAIKVFERIAPGANDLYLFCEKKPKFVKTIPNKIINKWRALAGESSKYLKKYNLILVHSLSPLFSKTILNTDKNTVVVWIGWGYDYYDMIAPTADHLFLPKTWLYEERNTIHAQVGILKKLKKILMRCIVPTKRRVIERVGYFSPVLPVEYDMVRSVYTGKFPEKAIWNYGNLEEDLVKGFSKEWVNGSAVLLGNSASSTNNHFDAFDFLSAIDFSARSVIVPLSYGVPEYRDAVIAAGKIKLGVNFMPLLDFMPIEQYVNTLLTCGFVIMNHVRQQAVGNIVIMLYLGAKVFLREECPTFQFFIHQGIRIYTVQALEDNPGLLNDPLDRVSMCINRQVIINNWSKDVSERKTRQLLEQVCGFKPSLPTMTA